jgi:PAS domain-containing protein
MEYKGNMKERELQDALEYAEGIINTSHDPLIILYEDLRVALASRSFYQAFRVTPQETEKQYIYDLGDHQWEIPKLRHLLEEVLPKNVSFDNFEIEHDFPVIGRRTMLLNARRIYLQANRTRLIVLTIKDISEGKKIEALQERVRDLEAQLKKSR